MGITTTLLLAFSLAMDAFAVAITRGTVQRFSILRAGSTGALFGLTAFCAPLLGWALAGSFAHLVTSIDHWIAFILLAGVGGHMLAEGIAQKGTPAVKMRTLTLLGTFMVAIGTSIDTAAVGISLAFTKVQILPAVTAIGLVSWVAAASGFLLARRIGRSFGERAEIIGGLTLVAIGGHILYSHLTSPAF
ncbi:MAG: hypothetical protein GC134_07015 [Proteobacteria bacterium]|nr:hypothetical protein [Pseudomonadota bacterium]